jgi:predicted phosphate transport protein (TIGR00153 family)
LFKFSFFPKEAAFFTLFRKGAGISVQVAEQLQDMLYKWEDPESSLEIISQLEHEGDTVTHEIIAMLHRTLITPFDREDIALLAHSMDDVTDFIEASVDAMILYKVGGPTDRARELSNVMVDICKEVERAVTEIEQSINLKKMLDRCIEINRLENVADKIYRAALADLFSDQKDMAFIIKWREIYEYMESAIDSCEDIANVLEGVALKYA